MQPQMSSNYTLRDRGLTLPLTLAFVSLAVTVVWMASTRHLHIDEPHNVFTMQLVMAWGDPGAGNPVDLHHVIGGLITRNLPTASQHYLVLRILFAAIFITTMLGVGFALPVSPPTGTNAGNTKLGWQVLAPAVIALSMGGAWLHGFEIRHDLLQACGIVAFAWLIRSARDQVYGWGARWMAAAIIALMQLTSHKAFTLWIPALFLLAYTYGRHGNNGDRFTTRILSMVQELARLSAPCAVAAAAGLGLLASAGALSAYLDKLQEFANYSVVSRRSSSVPAFRTMLLASPVAFVLSFVSLCSVAIHFLRGLRVSLPRALDTISPGVAMLAFCVVALIANPRPYSYNLVWVSAGLALATAEGLQLVLGRWWNRRTTLLALLVSASIATLFPLYRTPWFSQSMSEQMQTTKAVEAITSPQDRVLDGTGLVTSRQAPSRDWLLHSLFLKSYHRTPSAQFANIVKQTYPPVVILGHYRWRWLKRRDREAVAMWYRPASPTFWVLGYDLKSPDGEVVEIKRTGRYEVTGGSQLDGQPILNPSVHLLSEGKVQVSGPGKVSIRWVGPKAPSLMEVEMPKVRQLYFRPSAAMLKWGYWK
ncbi:hypothetical protein [Hydrogenophaga sp. 5NK40-0174]|uniref:hypothetical protein n=1 Tax=Hydrogenophaga sp. 5NK40-0174 TaxID=3127649 RepID=UPI00310B902C